MEGDPLTHVHRFATATHGWWKARDTCTPATVPTPRLEERRLAVMVAGLGSNSERDSIDSVDTARLGYAETDVLRFSYLGGTTDENGYVATDTTADIHHSARRLRQLLERLQARHPGLPIDVIAHSQGGIVARTALTDEVDGADPRLPAVKSLITLSSPHQGAPIATGLTMVGHTGTGNDAETAVHKLLPDMVDPRGKSVTQLAEHSQFMGELNRRPLPAGVNVTSIGAREDLVVPASVTRLEGAKNVTVSAPGHWSEHSAMPGTAETHRETALGLAGMAPTCQSLGNALADAAVSEAIRWGETGFGGGAYLGARKIDKKVKGKVDDLADRIPATTSRRSGS